MINAHFQIKNYRCFGEKPPLKFTLSDGVTAFVGTNNAGKSSVLKFFFEFRDAWKLLCQPDQLSQSLQKRDVNIPILEAADRHEVFQRGLSRNIEVEVMTGAIKISFEFTREQAKMNSETVSEVHIRNGSASNSGKIIESTGAAEVGQWAGPLMDLFRMLENSLYIPAFRNAINLSGDESLIYGDMSIGSAFVKKWHKWKTGTLEQKAQTTRVTQDIRGIFGYNHLDIQASGDQKTLEFVIDGKETYQLREMGAGIAQFVLCFGAAALRAKKPAVILIDEPELSLHPSLQERFVMHLATYASEATLIATHSLGLARTTTGQIYSIRSGEERGTPGSEVRPLHKTSNFIDFAAQLAFSAFPELGFEKLLLVEGPTDREVFRELLRKVRKDHQVMILDLGGDSNINGKREAELLELRRITDKIFCWIDSEKKDSKANPAPNRREFLENCKTAKIIAHATEKRAMENYFPESAIKAVKGASAKALDDYEEFIPAQHWSKLENILIANKLALKEIENTDLGKFLNNL